MYTCLKCHESFDGSPFDEEVTCPACGAVNLTDWDYVGDGEDYGIAAWTTGLKEG